MPPFGHLLFLVFFLFTFFLAIFLYLTVKGNSKNEIKITTAVPTVIRTRLIEREVNIKNKFIIISAIHTHVIRTILPLMYETSYSLPQ